MDTNNNSDFHFDDIDAFCNEDIETLIDKALGIKKDNKKVELYDVEFDLDKNKKKVETLEFEFDVPESVNVEEIEVMDFETAKDVETLDIDNDEIEELDFELVNERKIETLDFDNIDSIEFPENELPEPELFDFDLEEMDDIEVLDDSFFDDGSEAKSKALFKKKILTLLLIAMIIALMFVVYKIVRWKIDNDAIRKQVNDIHSYVNVENVDDSDNTVIIDSDLNIPNVDLDNLINVDFTELKNQNSDVVAWIKVNGTKIDYPVVQTSDNKYYLTHSFDDSNNTAGWIFADFRNNFVNDKNLIIYGHARLNETMFGSLKNVFKSFWYTNPDNYIVKLSTPNMNSNWLVFSTYTIPEEDYYIKTDFSDNASFYEFIKKLKDRSVYDYGVKLNENDRILTLSTCYTDNKRVVLHAKLVKYEKRT